MAFSQNTLLAPKSVLHLDGVFARTPLRGEHLNVKVQNTFGCGSFFGVRMALGHTGLAHMMELFTRIPNLVLT